MRADHNPTRALFAQVMRRRMRTARTVDLLSNGIWRAEILPTSVSSRAEGKGHIDRNPTDVGQAGHTLRRSLLPFYLA